jgi:hypothetical protein
LQERLEQARGRVAQLKAQLQSDPGAASRRQVAARERAERELHERLRRALDRMPELEAIKRRNGVPPERGARLEHRPACQPTAAACAGPDGR